MSLQGIVARRTILRSALAVPFILPFGINCAKAATILKLSHQFPGSNGDQGDFRDRMCRRFAADVNARTKGALEVQVYPGSSLMKTNAQFSSMRKAASDNLSR